MFTFGSTTATRINYTSQFAVFGANRNILVTCWLRPTTLTAGRMFCAAGATSAMQVHTTTTSVAVVLTSATTNGVYTAPAGWALNTTTFLAVFISTNSAGGTAGVRVWTAGVNTAPVEQTVTTTTPPVGGWSSSITTFSVGNGSGVTAWQGDVGGLIVMCERQSVFGFSPTFGIATVGTVTQPEANRVKAMYVDEAWRGNLAAISSAVVFTLVDAHGFQFAASLDDPLAYAVRAQGAPVAGAVNVAVRSALSTPHGFNNDTVRMVRGDSRLGLYPTGG